VEKIHDLAYVHSILTGEGPLSKCAFGYWSEDYRDGVLAINGGNLLSARLGLRMASLRMWPRAFITPHWMKVEAFLFSEFSFEHPLSSDHRMLSA
jgi:hypothetical protein